MGYACEALMNVGTFVSVLIFGTAMLSLLFAILYGVLFVVLEYVIPSVAKRFPYYKRVLAEHRATCDALRASTDKYKRLTGEQANRIEAQAELIKHLKKMLDSNGIDALRHLRALVEYDMADQSILAQFYGGLF